MFLIENQEVILGDLELVQSHMLVHSIHRYTYIYYLYIDCISLPSSYNYFAFMCVLGVLVGYAVWHNINNVLAVILRKERCEVGRRIQLDIGFLRISYRVFNVAAQLHRPYCYMVNLFFRNSYANFALCVLCSNGYRIIRDRRYA